MTDALLVFNTGSSSVRCALYACSSTQLLCRAHVEAIGTQRQSLQWSGPRAEELETAPAPSHATHADLAEWLLRTLSCALPELRIVAVGHRVVHGGALFDRPVRIDADALAKIEQLAPLAPNHQPQAIAVIQSVAKVWPQLPQIACFDTAFHRGQPRLAQLYGLPREFSESGILRYGFHGLSYEYLSGELERYVGPRADGRVILAHLGHGASLCAMLARRSIATTMGFSALDGLLMGTRCGAIDPGVLLYLLQQRRLSAERVSELLYGESGLLGVSGISDDLRELEASVDPRAGEAVELFAYCAAREIGSMAAAIGGLDVLVFSGGIGENSSTMRQHICQRAAWLGIALDDSANNSTQSKISNSASRVDVLVIPTDEEMVIVRATALCA